MVPLKSLNADSDEAVFLYEEISRVFKKKQNVKDGLFGVDEGRWELMVLEGPSPALRVEMVSEGEEKGLVFKFGF